MLAQPLIDLLHSEGRPRVWSIVVTILGDVIEPMGGKILMSDLIAICDEIGIERQAVRTAVSRLAKENWLQGEKKGRTASYEFTKDARKQSLQAASKIYAPPASCYPSDWQTALIPGIGYGRVRVLEALKEVPVFVINQQVLIWQKSQPLPDEAERFLWPIKMTPCEDEGEETPDWVHETLHPNLPFDQIDALIRIADGLLEALDALYEGPKAAIRERYVIRILLIHFWRRLVLKVPAISPPLPETVWRLPILHERLAKLYPKLVENTAALDGYQLDRSQLDARFS